MSNQKDKLDKLLAAELITQEEYDTKLLIVENTKKYELLKQAYQNDLLSKEEFLKKTKDLGISDPSPLNQIKEEKLEDNFESKKSSAFKNISKKQFLDLLESQNLIDTSDLSSLKSKTIISQPSSFNADLKIKRNLNSDKIMVEIKNLTKQYKGKAEPAVNNISFNILEGQFHAFIGANGAGKTTTIKSIIGAYSNFKYKGTILIDGVLNNKIEAKRRIGYIPENAVFPKKISVINYLADMAALSGYSSFESKKLASEVLANLNMSNFAKNRPSSFSSGQQKKILLAQALIHNPDILILDEPAANLDPIAREELFMLLIKLQQQGKSIFISSHILDEIGKYATFATILDGGKVVFNDTVNKDSLMQLYKQHVKFGSVDN